MSQNSENTSFLFFYFYLYYCNKKGNKKKANFSNFLIIQDIKIDKLTFFLF